MILAPGVVIHLLIQTPIPTTNIHKINHRMSSETLHTYLLRPAVIHILRAAGFHGVRPSVLDTLTDLCARHIQLLAERTACEVYNRTCVDTFEEPGEDIIHVDLPPSLDSAPTVTDVRLALTSAAVFPSSLSASEETWRESLRKPLHTFRAGAREKERQRRDAEDTRDIREFVDWATGPANNEIRRIAGVLKDAEEQRSAEGLLPEGAGPRDDYLTALKKKHSKTGEEARYAGTVLGKAAEEKGALKIEGGPASLDAWRAQLKRKRPDEQS